MFTIAALYHFTRFDDPASLRAPLQSTCESLQITGSLLLAAEGINGTVAGSASNIAALLKTLRICIAIRERPEGLAPFFRQTVCFKSPKGPVHLASIPMELQSLCVLILPKPV